MSSNKQKSDETIEARMDRLEADRREILEEIQKARIPGYNQPKKALASVAAQVKGQTGPFAHMGQFLRSVIQCPNPGNAPAHPLLKQWQGQVEQMYKALPSGWNETVGADGGYLVPPEFATQLLMRIYDNDLLSRTTMFPLTNSNTISIPAINETSRADGSRFGGVQMYWDGEAEDIALTKGSIMTVDLKVHKATLAARLTQELLDDANVALEQWLGMVAQQELAFGIGKALIRGNGVKKPEGILNSPSKISVSKQVGQAAATITTRNVNDMWRRLHPSCRGNAVWLYDQSIETQLAELTLGTAGAQLAVYLPPGGMSAAPYGTIKGKPALPIEFCSALGTEGDLILTDLSTVLSATKGGMQSAASMHVYFLTNEQVFRFILRLDARSWWRNPLTPHSGSDTQSNVVVLETRS